MAMGDEGEQPVPVEEEAEAPAAEEVAPADAAAEAEEGPPAEAGGETDADAEAEPAADDAAAEAPVGDGDGAGEEEAVADNAPRPDEEAVEGDDIGEAAEAPAAEDGAEAAGEGEAAPDSSDASPGAAEGEGEAAEGEGDAEEAPADGASEGRLSPEAAEEPSSPAGAAEEEYGSQELRSEAEPGLAESGRGSPSADGLMEEEGLPDGGVDSAMMEASGELSPGADDGALSPEFGEDGEFGEDDYEEDKVDPIQELQEKYDQLLELNERAMQTNVALQRRVIQRKAQDKSYDASEKQSDGKVTEHKYQNVLLNVHSVRLKLRLQQVKAARMSEELKNQLEAKRQKAIECRDSFQEFKRQVARHAEYARTGKKIPEKIIQEVEEFELDKDAEVEEVRGSNISLKNRLAKLEQALRKKDELAENLHVIDFEQLKIENQTLNEKIEERNEELHKLRKKTIVTVQIITHMREKVQFVQQEYLALKSELAQLELDLAAQRDTVTKTKHERDDIRVENNKYRQQTGITNSEGLSRDYDARAEHIKQLIQDIAQLKNRHKQMMQFVKRHGGKV